uniref:hypothetical protein n=1 Tax=Vibrio vulnificus TaxID=672 RepID=UPI0019D45B42
HEKTARKMTYFGEESITCSRPGSRHDLDDQRTQLGTYLEGKKMGRMMTTFVPHPPGSWHMKTEEIEVAIVGRRQATLEMNKATNDAAKS